MNRLLNLIGALTTLIVFISLPVRAGQPLDIGSRRELFVDHHLIEKLDGARLALHRPQPREVAIRFDQPWEMLSPGYNTIVHDPEQGLYRFTN